MAELESYTNEYDRLMSEYGYSPNLAKACVDEWKYAIKLLSGDMLIIDGTIEAINKDWIHVRNSPQASGLIAGRGCDIRVSSIAWIQDEES